MGNTYEPDMLPQNDAIEVDLGDVDLGIDVDVEVTPSQIDDALGLDAADFAEVNLAPDAAGNSTEVVDLGVEVISEPGSLATLLKTQEDISKHLKSYYQLALNALDKLYHTEPRQKAQKVFPPLTDFNYISSTKMRSMVYGFFCQMLDDLTSFEQYANLNEEQAFQEMLKELGSDLGWTPNVNYYRLQNTFMSYYRTNKKLAVSRVVYRGTQPGDLVDKERLQTAVDVFYANSIPFDFVTQFFADDSIAVKLTTNVNLDVLGDFAASLLAKYQIKRLPYKLSYQGIAEFFGSYDLMSILQITEDDLVELSIGELMRRLLVYELNDGTFYPRNMAKLKSEQPDMNLISQLISTLYVAIQQQSIAAEILFMTLDLMKVSGDEKIFNNFVVGISQYLQLFNRDKSLINPVFYTYIGNDGRREGEQVFSLGYARDDASYSLESTDVLYTVIGDNNNVFQVPLIYVDKRTSSVVCPPDEVVASIRQATLGGRMSVYGNACFIFKPSFSWLSTLNLVSDKGTVEEERSNTGVAKSDSPLLGVLMSYDNKFATVQEKPLLLSITSGPYVVTGLRRNGADEITLLQMQKDGVQLPLKHGVCILDSDGSGVMQYIPSSTGKQEVMILNSGKYECSTVTSDSAEETVTYFTVFDVLGITGEILELNSNAYLGSIVRRICEMTAFDYDSELEDVRQKIVRDLSDVLGVRVLELLVGSHLLDSFASLAEKGEMDSFNLDAARELLDVIVGSPNPLTGVSARDKEVAQRVIEVASEVRKGLSEEYHAYVSNYDPQVLALHSLSRGESRMTSSRVAYNALHYLPCEHAKLRDLENRMVLLHVLSEVGGEIESVIRRSPSLFTAYTKVCTVDSFESIEVEVSKRIRQPKIVHPMPTVRLILENDLPANFSLCKYFVLDHNLHGLLCGLEEYSQDGNTRYQKLYNIICEDLGFDATVSFSHLTEAQFNAEVTKDTVASIYSRYRKELLEIVHTGLVPEAVELHNLQVFRAYDLLCSYGHVLLNLSENDAENFNNTDEWRRDFCKYVGSLIVSYCPVKGESANAIDGGTDRWAAYLRNRRDFISYVPLASVVPLGLQDLRTVISAEEISSADGEVNGVQ